MKKSNNIKILFLDILTGDREVKETINNTVYNGTTYSEAMRTAFGLNKRQWFVIDASEKNFPKRLAAFNAIVMGGSTEDPVRGHEKAWMKSVYTVIRKAIKQQIPILGICGGLQFTVRALGGAIVFNPKGRELGSTDITLTSQGQRDPLFRGLAKNSVFQSSHKCMIKNLLPGWKLLATSSLCKNQAVAIGNTVRLVQFHPELTQMHLQAIARLRKTALMQEGFVQDAAEFKGFMNSIQNTTKTGRKVLKNFMRYFVLRNNNK